MFKALRRSRTFRRLPRAIRRPFRTNRLQLFTLAGIRIYINHWEVFWITLLVATTRPSRFEERLGTYLGLFITLVVHELGHLVFGALRGIKARGLTFGFSSGYYEYRRHGASISDESFLRKYIFMSWGGVAFEFILLLVAVPISLAGFWPKGPFARGLHVAFIPLNVAGMMMSLLPFAPFDGAYAWKILQRDTARRDP